MWLLHVGNLIADEGFILGAVCFFHPFHIKEAVRLQHLFL
jgi:hypothetical protein